ncbi:hypothetical protein D3C84_921470 [compost metagenome]
MAFAIVLLPVPLGPYLIFSLEGSSEIFASSMLLQFLIVISIPSIPTFPKINIFIV